MTRKDSPVTSVDTLRAQQEADERFRAAEEEVDAAMCSVRFDYFRTNAAKLAAHERFEEAIRAYNAARRIVHKVYGNKVS